jgi:hypothetical protein
MTSPLQVLFYMAITLAPPGTHHVTVSGGDEVYSWDKGDSIDDDVTWVHDWAAVDPKQVLANNDIVPDDVSGSEHKIAKANHDGADKSFVLHLDSAHQLQKNSQGYVYVVRPGSVNEKFYSFKFE